MYLVFPTQCAVDVCGKNIGNHAYTRVRNPGCVVIHSLGITTAILQWYARRGPPWGQFERVGLWVRELVLQNRDICATVEQCRRYLRLRKIGATRTEETTRLIQSVAQYTYIATPAKLITKVGTGANRGCQNSVRTGYPHQNSRESEYSIYNTIILQHYHLLPVIGFLLLFISWAYLLGISAIWYHISSIVILSYSS